MKLSLFYNHATVLDYAYLDDHQGVVGNAYIVNVEFIGHTDDEGVVYDFSLAKKKVKEIIDRDCDHRLVVPKNLTQFHEDQAVLNYSFGHRGSKLWYQCPAEGICEIPFHQVNESTLAAYLEEILMAEMPETISSLKITLEEEKLEADRARFHYTHGLKDHFGNCQRLFHGHKNTVRVSVDGQERTDLESYLATELFQGNIHFCFLDNVVNREEIKAFFPNGEIVGRSSEGGADVHIKYESSQGVFEGKLPIEMVYFTPTETTVENLSTHFAQRVREKVGTGPSIRVTAYEGIAKGAITTL